MSKSSLSPLKIFAGAGAILLFLLLSIYLSFQRFKEFERANAWNIHTYQVLLETSYLIRGLVNIQTGARGFLQTGDENFLAPYKLGRTEFEEHFDKALSLTQDNDIQQKRLKSLRSQYTLWKRNHIDPLIRLRRSAPNTEAALRLAAPTVRKRKAIMDAMRKTVAEVENTEIELLQQRTSREKQMQSLTKTSLLFNGAFALLLTTGLSLLLTKGARHLQETNRELAQQMKHREETQRQADILTEHNEMILQAANDGITGLNQAGRITFCNRAAEEITGYSMEELLGKNQHDLLHSKKADGSPYPIQECPILATLKDGKPHKASGEVIWRKDGTPISIEFTSAPLRNGVEGEDPFYEGKQAGDMVGAVIVFRDITERYKREVALRELASIVQNSDDAIIALNLDGAITRWNRAAAKTYGYQEYEIIGRCVDELMPPDSPNELFDLLDKIKARQPVEHYETTHLHRHGAQIQVVLTVSPILDDLGGVMGASLISRQVAPDLEHESGNAAVTDTPSTGLTSAEIVNG